MLQIAIGAPYSALLTGAGHKRQGLLATSATLFNEKEGCLILFVAFDILAYYAMRVLQEKAGVAKASGTSGTEKVGGCTLQVPDASDFTSFCRKHCMEHLCSNEWAPAQASKSWFFVPAVDSTGKGQNKGGKGKGGKK